MEENQQTTNTDTQEAEEQEEGGWSDWYALLDCLRANISTGLEVLNAMDVMDENSPFIINNNLQKKAAKAKKQSLELLFKNIDLLHTECFTDPGTTTAATSAISAPVGKTNGFGEA